MLLGRVMGTVTPAVVYDGLEGVPLLLVQPVDKHQKSAGNPFVAVDTTRMAGTGEYVYYEGGREAALALEKWFVPVDHAIIGIIDDINLIGENSS
jgi:ethanolamine utilization protein EutN